MRRSISRQQWKEGWEKHYGVEFQDLYELQWLGTGPNGRNWKVKYLGDKYVQLEECI